MAVVVKVATLLFARVDPPAWMEVLPLIVKPPKVGVEEVAIDWGKDSVMDPVLPDVTT